jgi:hypothetical protein
MKCCPQCRRELPATSEYFHRDATKKDGFQSACKKCLAQRYGHRYVPPAREGHKCCRRCDSELPATTEFFYAAKDRADGFYPYCKPCVKLIQQEQNLRWRQSRKLQAIEEKRCCRCGETKPVTEFHRAAYISDGYGCACKLCLSKAWGFRYVRPDRDGYKSCTQCGQEFPRTTEFFYGKPDGKHGLTSWCKTCFSKVQKVYRDRQEYTDDQQEQLRQDEPFKTCPRCHKLFARTLGFFYKDSTKPDGLSSMCQACIRDNVKVWSRANPTRTRKNAIISSHRRRARKRNLPDSFTPADWQRALDYFHGCCAVCERPLNGIFHSAHADHWIALSDPNCPGTVPTNMVPLCGGTGGCNQSKNDRPARVWLTQKFGKRKAAEILQRIETYFALIGGD